MRWIYHAIRRAELAPDWSELAPASLAREGFVHASYVTDVLESARLYLPKDEELVVLRIDPRLVNIRVDQTPRGPMPHILHAIPRSAVVEELALAQIATAPDYV